MKIVNNLITRNYTKGRAGLDMPIFFVLHTYGGKGTSLRGYFNNNNIGVSAHTAIWKDGTVEILVPWIDTAHHAGNWWVNVRSIGIETQDDGNYQDSARTPQLYEAISDYISLTAFNLGHKILNEHNIKRHNEIVNKACPGGLDVQRIIRESNTKLQKMLNPVDNLYKVLLDGVQQGAYSEKDNAFNKWSENFAQKVLYNGADITFQFIEMAKPLQDQITELIKQVEQLTQLNEKQQELITQLNLDLKTQEELLKLRDEQLTQLVNENARLKKEVETLTDKLGGNKPFNLILFILSLFKRK